jgi:hypothetical protein
MFGESRPNFGVVKEGWILHYPFLLCFKVPGDRSFFAKHHLLPSLETVPEATRINLVKSSGIMLYQLLDNSYNWFFHLARFLLGF